ncbi:hypothetical protein ACWCOW_42675, partial [Streptomyces sp. NPDC001939]
MTAPEGSGKDDCVVAVHMFTQNTTLSNGGAHESRSTGRPSRAQRPARLAALDEEAVLADPFP